MTCANRQDIFTGSLSLQNGVDLVGSNVYTVIRQTVGLCKGRK